MPEKCAGLLHVVHGSACRSLSRGKFWQAQRVKDAGGLVLDFGMGVCLSSASAEPSAIPNMPCK